MWIRWIRILIRIRNTAILTNVSQAVMSEIKSGFFKMDKLDLLLPKFSVAGSLELTGPLGDLNMSRVSPP
jgi:hypothetical protein